MEYYNPNDNSTKRYAALATIAVMGLIALAVSFISISVSLEPRRVADVVVEFAEEPEKPVEKPKPKPVAKAKPSTDVRKDNSPAHVKESKEEPKSAQAKGEDEKTQTSNPKALFNLTEPLSTESVATGNSVAPDGDAESRHGEGQGYNLEGTDQLDEGLKGRGLREALPMPRTAYNTAGEVVVRVEVDANGHVVSATMVKGSDQTLIDLAIEAAKKAKFKKGDKTSVGTITYGFNLH